MKQKHILLVFLILLVAEYLFVFKAFGLKADYGFLALVTTIVTFLSSANFLGSMRDPNLAEYGEIRIGAFVLAFAAFVPTIGFVIGFKAEFLSWLLSIVSVIAILAIIVGIDNSTAGRRMAHYDQNQPRH